MQRDAGSSLFAATLLAALGLGASGAISPGVAQDATAGRGFEIPETEVDNPGPFLEIEIAGEANGRVVIDLFEEAAPLHTERLMTLAEEGAYDGVVFHRVIDGFMAQTGDVEHGRVGGDMRRAGMGGSDLPDLPWEISEFSFDRGMVGMARARDPNSANSQFFIMFDPGTFLDGQYTVIGAVTEGMEVVDAIKRGTGPNGSVVGAPDIMETVRVVE